MVFSIWVKEVASVAFDGSIVMISADVIQFNTCFSLAPLLCPQAVKSTPENKTAAPANKDFPLFNSNTSHKQLTVSS